MVCDLNFGYALCYVRGTINGVDIDYDDFGDKYDHAPEIAPDYGCGNMSFDPKPATSEVLEKYKITLKEYEEICEKLTDGLHFGYCAWCS